MKEIVTIQIGKCGNNLGTQFWENLCFEHGLDYFGSFRGFNPDIQLQKIDSFFREIRGLRYTPRAVMIDLDRDSMDNIKSSPFSSIFRQDHFVYGQGGTGNNWAKGHHTEGAELKNSALEIIRKEAENTDCLQAFQFIHSIGGGTGSGFGSLIMHSLKDEYPGRNISTFTVIPSPNDPKSGMEIYNAVLSFNHLIAYSDETYCMDNLSLHHICSEVSKVAYNLSDLNHVIASAMSGVTTSMRFRGQTSTDFRKIAVNFVPYPRLHFFVPAVSPVVIRGEIQSKFSTMSDLIFSLFLPRKMFMDCDVKLGKFLTIFTIFRGGVCYKEILKHVGEIQNKNSAKFVEWVPDNMKIFVYSLPPNVVKQSATMISNTSSIRYSLKRLKDQFHSMFRRKAFIEPFKSEGMDDMEFEEAAANLRDLLDEYKQSQTEEAERRDTSEYDIQLD